jgi:hypothetical protein
MSYVTSNGTTVKTRGLKRRSRNVLAEKDRAQEMARATDAIRDHLAELRVDWQNLASRALFQKSRSVRGRAHTPPA